MGHEHAPLLSAAGVHRRRLVAVLAITVGVLVVEVVGAVVTDSLALLADAGHMFTDVAGLSLALLAITLGARPATPERTFGYYRLEILAALVNALLLCGVAAFILWEAWQRWDEPPTIDGGLMLAFAVVGLAANAVSLYLLQRGARESLNVRGAYLEVFGDLLGSIAVIVAAILIAAGGWLRADVVASVVVAFLILPRTWTLVRDAVDVLLEATPKNIDMARIRQHILGTPGVIGTHDLHAWTITSGLPVLSAHVVITDDVLADGGGARVLDLLGECLSDHFDMRHCTFQLEPASHADHEHPGHD